MLEEGLLAHPCHQKESLSNLPLLLLLHPVAKSWAETQAWKEREEVEALEGEVLHEELLAPLHEHIQHVLL